MNLLTELLLAILISALLAANTVVQTNQTTNETAAIAVGAYLMSVAGAVARFAQANSGAAPTAMSQLSTPGGLGLSSNIPAGNGSPIFGVANIISAPGSSFTSTIAYACTPRPLSIRQVNTDASGRDSLVNAAIISMGGGGARTYSANTSTAFGAFGSIDLTSAINRTASTTYGNGMLCAWKNIYNSDVLRPSDPATTGCSSTNEYQMIFDNVTLNKPLYCNGARWRGFDGIP